MEKNNSLVSGEKDVFNGRLCLKPKEAAVAVGVSLPTMYQWCATEGFPAIRSGRGIVIPVSGLVRWLDQQAGGVLE